MPNKSLHSRTPGKKWNTLPRGFDVLKRSIAMLGAAGVILTENERKISEFQPESQNFFDITYLNIIDCKAIMSIARAQCKHEPIWA